MGHVHAELMMQYAQDAMETSEPWKLWEVRHHDVWCGLSVHPSWHAPFEYRRKPKMISVTLMNGEVVSWPAPHRTELEYGDLYFYVAMEGIRGVGEWDCDAWDRHLLANGYIHLTKQAAEQHAAALHKITNQGD